MDDDSRAKKQQHVMMSPRLDADSDIILKLPREVRDQILVRLPIRDAVRTSVLSTNWRYIWTTSTQLVIHDDKLVQVTSPPHNNHNNNINDKLINFIDRSLLLHNGFIHKFELSNTCLPISSSMIDAWILILSRKNIKELVLNFSPWGGERYELPSCFFSAQQITTLELEWCVLKPPSTFTGFSNLKSLYLYDTKAYGGFECLISKCPVLERLTLDITYGGINHLNISSPNLKYLCLYGTLDDICFVNTPLLSDVTIRLSRAAVEKFLQSETGNVVKLLSSLPKLGKFEVGGFFLKFSSLSKIPEKLPFTCHHLKNLSLRFNFEDVNELCVTLCLLNSSPNLQELEIESYSFCNSGQDIENFWEERTLIHWNMSELQIVKITYIKGFNLELEFIKLLLANSPMLEMLSIRTGDFDIHGCKGLEFLKELLIFPRASPKAKIKFLNS